VICRLLASAAVAFAVLGGTAGARPLVDSITCSTPNCPITINDNTAGVATVDEAATPYPSNIVVNGIEGTPSGFTVTVTGYSHGFSDDVDMLLVSPAGTAVELLSDAGGTDAPNNLTLTFSDSATQSLPDSNGITGGTWRPSNYAGGGASCQTEDPTAPTSDVFPAPAPAPGGSGYGQLLNALVGQSGNGTWKLFVGDDCTGGNGSIASWTLTLLGAASAVRVYGLRGEQTGAGVRLSWRTGTDAGLAGFDVLRVKGGRTAKLNRALIRAKATSAAGASYGFVDGGARRGVSHVYRLVAVSLAGARTIAGTVAVR